MVSNVFEISTTVEHKQRRMLNDEVHARPPDHLPTPASLSYIVRMPARESSRDSSPTQILNDLLQRFGVQQQVEATKHLKARLGNVRLRWEKHTEYNRYTFAGPGNSDDAFSFSDNTTLPGDWLQSMQGEVLVGVHAAVVALPNWDQDLDGLSERYFDGNTLIGSNVADGRAIALTDLVIREDGFSRLLVINEAMPDAQCGRVVQRLLEIETYRMLALLALPIAQQLSPVLDESEAELAAIGEALVNAESQQEQPLLDRITRLSAASQHRHLRNTYRFAAADAYYEIVKQRIHELRESRIPGLQTFEEFTNRRLTPAVKTYRAVYQRQQSILEQMARATKLLSTRIDIDRQQQNQSLLASMNRRAKAQLRLQATVEGLSVAAVTYYLVGLIGVLADSGSAFGLPLNRALVMGISIPLIAGTAYLGIRRIRRNISQESIE